MESWVFLLVGGLGAIGAALSLGTLAALVQYRRHGTLPGHDQALDQEHDQAQDVDQAQDDHRDVDQGQDQDADRTPPPPPPGIERQLWVRIVMGAVVAAVCFGSLAEQGLLFGSLLG